MSLNLDVLISIMSVFARPETKALISMMHTCRALYSAGVPCLLQWDVTLWRDEQLESFYRFIFSGKEPRFHYLRNLGVYLHKLRSPKLLAEILQHASRLEELSLQDCQVLDEDPQIARAIASLPNIKQLVLRGSKKTDTALYMFGQMQPSLVKLSLAPPYGSYLYEDDIRMLSSIGSLQELNIRNPKFTSAGLKFPQLRALELSDCRNAPLVKPLVLSFPNLRVLKVSIQWMHWDQMLNPIATERHREKNKQAQLSHSWKDLDFVLGSDRDLYLMALTCKIHCLEVTSVKSGGAPKLSAVLADSRPTDLRLTMDTETFGIECLKEILGQGLEQLTHLSLSITLQINDTLRMESYIIALMDAIRELTITHLKLRFTWDDLSGGHSDKTPMETILCLKAKPTEDTVGHALAERAMLAVPSLRYMLVECTSQADSFWQMEGDMEHRCLKKLSGDHSLQIMRNESPNPSL